MGDIASYQHFESKMGKFAELLALLGLWMLVAGRSEAISTGQIRSDSMYIVHMDNSLSSSKNFLETPFSMYSNLLRSMKQDSSTFLENDASTAQPVQSIATPSMDFQPDLRTRR